MSTTFCTRSLRRVQKRHCTVANFSRTGAAELLCIGQWQISSKYQLNRNHQISAAHQRLQACLFPVVWPWQARIQTYCASIVPVQGADVQIAASQKRLIVSFQERLAEARRRPHQRRGPGARRGRDPPPPADQAPSTESAGRSRAGCRSRPEAVAGPLSVPASAAAFRRRRLSLRARQRSFALEYLFRFFFCTAGAALAEGARRRAPRAAGRRRREAGGAGRSGSCRPNCARFR